LHQHLSEVANHNVAVNAELQLTISQLKRNNQLALDSANLKAADAISKVWKDGAAKISQLKSTVKEKDNEIVEMQEIAEEVADEYTALERSARAETCSKLATTAAKRLENLKQTKEREGELREKLDTVMETYEDKLTAALAEITKLKEELREKDFVAEGLEKELETATEKIEVSLQVL
jgi:chromosome segregation ATPase